MDDLLKEAIADAKAVRETALQNAKIALEEAFNPQVKAMLAKQIQTEMEDDEEEVELDDEEEFEADEDGDEEIAVEPEVGEDEMEMEDEPEMEEEPELDGEESLEDEGEFEGEDEFSDEDEEEDELDLEATIKELEDEMSDDEEEIEFDDEEDDVVENDDFDEDDEELAFDVEDEDDEDEEIDEDADLQELINQLIGEDEDEDEDEDDADIAIENAKLKSELEEHVKVVRFLKNKINEVNLLNSKLLYTNKLFRAFELDNEKKYKVVETFDRAKNLREVKLIFSTIAESFGAKTVKKAKINETKIKSKGASSKAVQSTSPKTESILEEGVDLRARYQRLANIKTK